MSEAGRHKQIDTDILRCKADVLCAKDATAPYRDKLRQKPEPQAEHIGPSSGMQPIESAIANQENIEIPRFDLAEDIMAEQRKITAVRRKAPGRKVESQGKEQKSAPMGYTIGQPAPVPIEQEQIVAEIVARDIERLYRDGTLSTQGRDLVAQKYPNQKHPSEIVGDSKK